MLRGRDDISTKVKLINLPEGNDVDPSNVITADLNKRANTELNVQMPSWTPKENTKCEMWIKLCTSHTV